MSERKWGFFPFDAMDYKAAQAYLDKKAAQGWVLDKLLFKHFARFVPAEGRYHSVDIDLPRVFEDDLDWNYVQFCEDAGWELAASVRSMLIFRSRRGRRPVPIQTDEGMETERFWKKYVRRNLLVSLILLLILVPLCLALFTLGGSVICVSELLCTNSILLLPPLLLFAVVCLLRSWLRTIAVYVSFHRSGSMPKRKPFGAWLFGLLALLMRVLLVVWWFLYMAEGFSLGRTVDLAWSSYSGEYTATPELCQTYPVITAADLGLEYSEDSRYLDGRCSLLTDFLDYSEITDGEAGATHILTTMRYECASETIARLMFAARRSETARGAGFTWGKLEWGETTSDWGFDQVCTARDNSYLLLRDGNTVVLVGATGFDLTGHPDILRERLLSDVRS